MQRTNGMGDMENTDGVGGMEGAAGPRSLPFPRQEADGESGQPRQPAVVDDVLAKLAELTELVTGARAMPMSASCVVNRTEVLRLLGEIDAALPAQLREAAALLRDRDAVIAEGRGEAARLLAVAVEERAGMLAEHEIAAAAAAEAARVVEEAHSRAAVMQREIDDYVDTKLANFEVVLGKTLGAVARGREKLRARQEFFPADDDDVAEPLPG